MFPFFDSISAVIAYTVHPVSVRYANESPVASIPPGSVDIATVHFPGSVGIVVKYGDIASVISCLAILVSVVVSGASG